MLRSTLMASAAAIACALAAFAAIEGSTPVTAAEGIPNFAPDNETGWVLDRSNHDDLLPTGTSLQGDAVFPRLLEELATHEGHRFDLRDAPDLIAPLAAAALFATAPTTISGVQHARTKESDRISALAGELRKLGAAIDEADDGLRIEPLPALPHHAVELDPHRDHRLAMLFGVLSLRIPQIEVLDPGCVTKSFPDFWGTLDRLRAPEGSF